MNADPHSMVSPSRRWLPAITELLSSMRFAVTLLTLLAIASVVGTVLKQNEPLPNYVNEFGPFWAELFGKLSLYRVYSSAWFLLILAFLVVSTTLCIVRNAPKMIADMRAWKDQVHEGNLRAMHDRFELQHGASRAALADAVEAMLRRDGWGAKRRDHAAATLVVGKRGAATKLGYIFAHTAIVVICLGGLIDGDLLLRLQMLTGSKMPLADSAQGMLLRDIPSRNRLDADNPSFRANLLVPEGGVAANAVQAVDGGMLVQDLPFSIKLNKFLVEYYSTGMPKLFASDIVITDLDTGKQTPARVEVNKPVTHRGIAIYQSSFEDGGSTLKLTAYPLHGAARTPFAVAGEVGTARPLAGTGYTVEFTGFRPLNVENVGNKKPATATGLSAQLNAHLGASAKTDRDRELRNVGPSIQYKLRDASGQAREYNNYMQPASLDGHSVFLVGVRDSPDEAFSYLKIPADERGSLNDWLRLRAALDDDRLRAQAAARFAQRATPSLPEPRKREQLRAELEKSVARALALFAGKAADGGTRAGGFQAIAQFLEQSVPAAERPQAAEVLLRIVGGALGELWTVERERAGLPAPTAAQRGAFLEPAVNALSDSFFYEAPVLLELSDFSELKASVFQLTRSPGQKIVYLGCLLLIVGVFAMFYVRERRVWFWIRDDGPHAHLLAAMTTTRRTLDFEREFVQLQQTVAALPSAPQS